MVINVSEALDSDTAEQIVINRSSPGAYVDGLYVAGSTTIILALASVQQPNAEDLSTLDEAERTRDVRKFISNREIQTADEELSLEADMINYNGQVFKAIAIQNWFAFGHTTILAVRVKSGP